MTMTRAQDAHAELTLQLSGGAPAPCQVAADPEDWWPIQHGDAARTAAAVAACSSCRVLEACRDYALAAGEEHGVWGGTTPADRGAARRRRVA